MAMIGGAMRARPQFSPDELMRLLQGGPILGNAGPAPTSTLPQALPAGGSAQAGPNIGSLPPGMFGGLGRQGGLSSSALAPDQAGIQRLADGMPKARLHFFDKGGLGSKILNGLGEVALNYSASHGDPVALMTLRQRAGDRDAQREQQIWQQRHDLQRGEQLADRDYEANQPRYFSGGQDQVRFDPRSGQSQTIYDAPLPAESYASNFGAPGSDEYRSAMSDYVLRGWGDTATGNRSALDAQRFGQRQQLRQMPTYRDTHPRPTAPRQPTVGTVIAGLLQKQNNGQPLTPGEQQTLTDYRSRVGGGRGGRGAAGSGQPGTQPVRVNTPDDARRLPSGTVFQTPDGQVKVRP